MKVLWVHKKRIWLALQYQIVVGNDSNKHSRAVSLYLRMSFVYKHMQNAPNPMLLRLYVLLRDC